MDTSAADARSPDGTASSGSPGTEERKESLTTFLVNDARARSQIFMDGDRSYIRYAVQDHHEVWPIKSPETRAWLTSIAAGVQDKWPSPNTVRGVTEVLDGIARLMKLQVPVNIRCARKGNALYLDLGNDDWTCAEITKDGWKIIAHPEDGPYFRRSKRLQPLPVPIGGGNLEELLGRYLRLGSEADLKLVIAFLVDALKGRGPYLALTFIGGQGSSKTSASQIVVSIIDPSKSRSPSAEASPTSLRMKPRSERDFPSMIGHSHVLGLDNLSFIEDWLSDALCVLCTGGDISERTLFENFEESSMAALSPVVLNGIESFVTRGDLADRTIRLTIEPIDDAERLEETAFWGGFERDHSLILGSLLDTVSAAMREHPNVELARKPRMADFARWGVAVERALRWEEGSFLTAYEANRADAVAEMLSGDAVANMLIRFMADRARWEGTATELLTELSLAASVAMADRDSRWPKSPRGLTGRLQRLAAVLPQFGIRVSWTDRKGDRNKVRTILIENTRRPAEDPVPEPGLTF
jgi:putative DNA primase/helicase